MSSTACRSSGLKAWAGVGRTASSRPSALSSGTVNQRWSGADSAPTPQPPDACGRPRQAPHTTMQRIAAALATRSIGLVDAAPVGIELFCNISSAAASARALSLRRSSCSSCRMRFLSALACAFSACCKALADCWPRIQAWRHCWTCSG